MNINAQQSPEGNRRKTDAPVSVSAPKSAYEISMEGSKEGPHTLVVYVDNEPGVLARVVGLFSGRGYNIESLTVTEVEHEQQISRITIVTKGVPKIIMQIRDQLERLVPVHRVAVLNNTDYEMIERELAMVKVRGVGDKRLEALRMCDAFDATVIDATLESFVFQITGRSIEIERFIQLMQELGLVEVVRTGVAAITRGAEGV